MARLEWDVHRSQNLFEAIVGVHIEYVVHSTQSTATTPSEVRETFVDVVERAMSRAPIRLSDAASRMLILWDFVYSTLTVVFTDRSMMRDDTAVTKCVFTTIDKHHALENFESENQWEAAAVAYSQFVLGIIREIAAPTIGGRLPEGMTVHFSDIDRTMATADEFEAQEVDV